MLERHKFFNKKAYYISRCYMQPDRRNERVTNKSKTKATTKTKPQKGRSVCKSSTIYQITQKLNACYEYLIKDMRKSILSQKKNNRQLHEDITVAWNKLLNDLANEQSFTLQHNYQKKIQNGQHQVQINESAIRFLEKCFITANAIIQIRTQLKLKQKELTLKELQLYSSGKDPNHRVYKPF